jgi:hypothetical protein
MCIEKFSKNIFVLNLKKREDRLEHIKRQLKKIGCDNYSIIECVDGSLVENPTTIKNGAYGLILTYYKIYEEIKAIYSPIFISFDNALNENVNSDMVVPNASHPANFCTSMFYSIHKSDHFRTVSELSFNMKYDFVIRSRFDLALNCIIDFSKLEKGKVYVSKDTDGPNALLNDQFAIADSDTMNIYSSTYLFLRHHYNKGVPLCGHSMLEAQLKLFGIPIERIDLNHPFEDGKYNIGRHSIIRNDMEKWVDPKIWGY